MIQIKLKQFFRKVHSILHHFVFFNQVDHILKIGSQRIVKESDFIELASELQFHGNKIDESEINFKNTKSFILDIFKLAFPFWRWGIVIDFFSLFFTFLTAPLMHELISLLSRGLSTDQEFQQAIILGLILGMTGVIGGMLSPINFYQFLRTYIVINQGISRKLYRKAMVKMNSQMDQLKSGDIFNHISQDVDSLSNLPLYTSEAFITVASILIASTMLFHYIGLAAFAAIVVIVSLIPLSHYISKNYQKRNRAISDRLDQRMSLMSQTVNAIRLVKFYAWEVSIQKQITGIRNQEMKIRLELARFELITTLVYFMSSSLTLLISLFVYVQLGGELNPAIVFAIITLIDQLSGPLSHTPYIISAISQAQVAADRLCQYLSGLEQNEIIKRFIHNDNHSTSAVEIKNLSIQFDQTEKPFIQNLNLKIKKGESIAIIGPVAAGKSTILKAIIGEVPIIDGQIIRLNQDQLKSVSYVQQDAFILNETLEKNITFYADHTKKERVNEVIFASCLDQDLLQFPDGLATEIGEKGVNLSGGQKQRVSLARAAYCDSDLILLDDPLSAVDHQTEKNLIDRLIFGFWKNKTRIVVTHRLEHLDSFDRILFVDGGQIIAQGKFEDLLDTHVEFQEFFQDHLKTQHAEEVSAKIAQLDHQNSQSAQQFMTKEDQETGAVQFDVYWQYIRSLAGHRYPQLMIFLLCAAIVIWSLAPVLQTYWLGMASARYSTNPIYVLQIFAVLSLMTMLTFIGGMYFWMVRSLKAGYDLHSQMLSAVLKSPISFFDTTPLGRILHRFSRDMDAVDSSLYRRFSTTLECLVQIVISVVLVIGLLPPVILFVIPVLWSYFRIQKIYRASAREVKRIDSVLRSPKAAFFKESVSGLVSIRAYGFEQRFFEIYLEKLNRSQKAFFNHVLINRWFSVRMPMISGVISIATAVIIAFGVRADWLTAATSGILLTTCIGLWRNMNQAIRMFADIESVMTSVERIKHFTELPAEPETQGAPLETPQLEHWPRLGQIEFRHAGIRYQSHLPWIFKNLDVTLPAQTRIGLVGRTGSGKTTLLQAIYRFIPTSEGKILIDGIDISSIPLSLLRKALAIIPQDPILFKGNLRDNLDRDREFSNEHILKVLNEVEFAETLQEKIQPDRQHIMLQMEVSENGQNYSQGQRQLICLARALLLDSRIIILDEATSSLDVQTDQKIQKVLMNYCQNRTVIIIAHRLGTLKDCQYLLKIENGQATLVS